MIEPSSPGPKGRLSRLLNRLSQVLQGRRHVVRLPWRQSGPSDGNVPPRERFRVAQDDLLREYTLAEVEAHERAVDPLGGVAPVPFGHLNPVWQRFVSNLQPGDRIWRFNAQRVCASGEAVIRSGYVAVRAGQPLRPLVASFRTVDAATPLGALAASTAPVTLEISSQGPVTAPDAPARAASPGQTARDAVASIAAASITAPSPPPRTMVEHPKSAQMTDGLTKDSTKASLPRHQEPVTIE